MLFLFGQFYPADFIGNEHILCLHGHNLVGELVDADERGDVFAVAPFQFHDTSHVARFKQVLLILLGEDVPEIRTVKFRFLSDSVDAEDNRSADRLLERQACVGAQYGGSEVHADGHDLVGLVALEHLVEESALLEILAGQPEFLQFLPVDHGLVVTVLGLLLAAILGCLLRGLIFLCHFFLILMVYTLVFLVAGDNLVFLEKFLHGFGLLSCRNVLDRLPYFRGVQRVLPDGEDAEPCRVFELAPEVLQEILEHVGVAVDFQKGILVFLVCRNRLVPAVL